MKTKSKQGHRRFVLKISSCGCVEWIEQICELEAALARKPRELQIDLVGAGEIPPDSTLLIRSILMGRPTQTRIITNARSSLEGGSVLVWLLGDMRIIREDAKLFFKRANADQAEEAEVSWKDKKPSWLALCEDALEDASYARVLELINEFLPVKELAGRLIEVSTLRQFWLAENEKADQLLAVAFGMAAKQEKTPEQPDEKRVLDDYQV